MTNPNPKLLDKIFGTDNPGYDDWYTEEVSIYGRKTVYFEVTLNACPDTYARLFFDKEPLIWELIEAFAWFRESTDLPDEAFGPWYEWHVLGLGTREVVNVMREPTDEHRVRRNLIEDKLSLTRRFATDVQNGDESRSKRGTFDTIKGFLDNAIERLWDNPDAVFEVNGYSGSFEDTFYVLECLYVLIDYINGERLPYNSPMYRMWYYKDGLSEHDQRVLGYVLRICDDAVAAKIRGNMVRNQRAEDAERVKLESGSFPSTGRIFTLGAHDHHSPLHWSGLRDFLYFEIEGDAYILGLDYELPYSRNDNFTRYPVWEMDAGEDGAAWMTLPHSEVSAFCTGCDRRWRNDHGHDWRQDRYPPDQYQILDLENAADYDDLEEVEPDADGPPPIIPTSPGQQRMFDKDELYEGELLWGDNLPEQQVWFPQGTVVIDRDEDIVYCPACHSKLDIGGHAAIGE